MNFESLSELASLQALDTLDETEASWLALQLADSPALQAEMAEFEAAVAMLAYTAPLVPPATTLKERLFQRIGSEPTVDEDETTSLLAQAAKANWQPYSLVPGVEMATHRIDLVTRQVDCFVRGTGRIRFPQHRHADQEEILVLSGDLAIADQVYVKGDRIYSQPGTIHQPETFQGCILFIRTSMDDEILNPS